MTTNVLDTTVLLYDPEVFYKLQGLIVVPSAVLKEIDGLKRGDDATARNARQVARTLDRIGSYEDYTQIHGTLAHGTRLSTGASVMVYPNFDAIDDLASPADNKIIGCALKLQRERTNDHVIVLTQDGNMRTAARSRGLSSHFYPPFWGDIAKALDTREKARRLSAAACIVRGLAPPPNNDHPGLQTAAIGTAPAKEGLLRRLLRRAFSQRLTIHGEKTSERDAGVGRNQTWDETEEERLLRSMDFDDFRMAMEFRAEQLKDQAGRTTS